MIFYICTFFLIVKLTANSMEINFKLISDKKKTQIEKFVLSGIYKVIKSSYYYRKPQCLLHKLALNLFINVNIMSTQNCLNTNAALYFQCMFYLK